MLFMDKMNVVVEDLGRHKGVNGNVRIYFYISKGTCRMRKPAFERIKEIIAQQSCEAAFHCNQTWKHCPTIMSPGRTVSTGTHAPSI